MRDYINIEKSAFRRGEYVGYANGVWRITKSGPVNTLARWRAVRLETGDTRCAPTLANLSEVLLNVSQKRA